MDIEKKIDGINEQLAQVSMIAAEMGKTKAALNARWWRRVAIILLALLLLSNALWIGYASQLEKVVETTDTVTTTTFEDIVADADDGSNINFAGGDMTNGGKG